MIAKRGVWLLASALFLFILLSFCCNATLVFNKYILPNETAVVQGNTFIFSLNDDWEKLYFKGNGTSGILQIQNCRQTTYYTVCFNGTRYNLSKGWGIVDQWNREIPLVYVKISDRTPSIEVTRTIDNSSLILGEETTFRVEIENTGDTDLNNVVYTDELPKQLLIMSYPRMVRESNKLTWEGSISAGNNRSMYYEVKALAPFNVQSKAKVVYEYAGKSKTVETKSLKIKVIEPLNLTYGFTKNNLTIYENTSFYINLLNSDQVYPINVTYLRVYISGNLLVKAYSSDMTKLSDGSYRWVKAIAKSTKAGIEMNLSSQYYGTYTIKAELKYITHDTEAEKAFTQNLTYYISKLEPIFQLGDANVRSGKENQIEIGLRNKNKKISFKDIRCSFESNLIGDSARSYEQVGENGEISLLSLNFTPPYYETKKNYSITASCNYKSQNSQQFFTSATYNITANPGIVPVKTQNATANTTIQFGSFDTSGTGGAGGSTSSTAARSTTTLGSTTTSAARQTATTLQEESEKRQEPQAAGVLGFFARIGRFVRGIFG